jgi:hypothetical protein
MSGEAVYSHLLYDTNKLVIPSSRPFLVPSKSTRAHAILAKDFSQTLLLERQSNFGVFQKVIA